MTTKLLICTDLDRTLIPNGLQPESGNTREHFRIMCQHPDVIQWMGLAAGAYEE